MDRTLDSFYTPFRVLASAAAVVALVVACSGGSGETPANDAGVVEAGTDGATTPPTDGATNDVQIVPPPPGKFSFTGVAEEPMPPAGSKVVVYWDIFSGSPDYIYTFGGGVTSGSDVYVSFAADPPAEALNGAKLGIGIVLVVDASFQVKEGKLTTEERAALFGAVKAISTQDAVIFRASTEQLTSAGWDVAFPQGFACGRCEDREAGFDGFIVEDCKQLTVRSFIKGTTKFCNYT